MFFTFAVAIPSAWAGSPHFIGNTQSASASGNTLTASGKETGLGNEAQVHIVLSATAQCINNGGKNPKAGNKTNVAGAGDFPVQNGNADFSLTATATFQPDCAPPMSVSFTDITLTDTTNGSRRISLAPSRNPPGLAARSRKLIARAANTLG
jgi:hypothetical protein